MKISYDETKRRWTLEYRGLDFVDAEKVLNDTHVIQEDDRNLIPNPVFWRMGFWTVAW